MSNWTFSATVDVTRLLELTRRLGSVGDMLFDVAEQTADKVQENIRQKDIIDTGALLKSITAEKRGEGEAVVRDNVSYGVYNEFGTSKMAARPFFMPAVEQAGEIIEKKFTEIFR